MFLLRTWQSLGLFMLISHETRWMTEEWTNRNIWSGWRLCLSIQKKASSWTNSLLPESSFIPVHGEETSLPLPESWLIHNFFFWCQKVVADTQYCNVWVVVFRKWESAQTNTLDKSKSILRQSTQQLFWRTRSFGFCQLGGQGLCWPSWTPETKGERGTSYYHRRLN